MVEASPAENTYDVISGILQMLNVLRIVLHPDPTLLPEPLQVHTYTIYVKVTKTKIPQAVRACIRMTTYWGEWMTTIMLS